MGTPARTSIILDVKSKLTAITIANGYKTTVATVEPYARGRDDVSTGLRPYLCFWVGRETAEHETGGFIKVVMPLSVIGIVTQADWTLRSAAINNLVDDVITALLADPTRAGNAIATSFLSCITDEDDPDAGADGGEFIAEFSIEYERQITAE